MSCEPIEQPQMACLVNRSDCAKEAACGEDGQEPQAMSEAALSPLVVKSASLERIGSSKPTTSWCNCVLTPQTRKSPYGGIARKMMAGDSLAAHRLAAAA